MSDNNYYLFFSIFVFIVVATNVPFGYLRKGYPKYSRPWARCLYIPIIINIILRRFFGFTYGVIPFIAGAVVIGQILGGTLRGPKRADGVDSQNLPDMTGR